jgi:predicted PurR-regulated permease PerM
MEMDKRWLRRGALLAGAALLILLRGMLGRIALLLLVSATMAYLLYPLARMFTARLRCGEGLAAALAFLTAVLAIIAFLLVGIPAVVRQTEALGRSAPEWMESWLAALEGLLERLRAMGLPQGVLNVVQAQAGNLVGKGAEFLAGKLTIVVQAVTSRGYLIFSPVLAYYMLRDRRRLFGFLTRMIPSKHRKSVLLVAHSVRDAMAAYVGGQITVSAITGSLTAIGLMLIGVEGWLLLGAVMLLCNLIPYFGPWLGAIPVILFAAQDGLIKVLMGLAVVLAAQQVEGLFVSPRIIGNAASLHPALVIVSLMAGGWLAGLPGMFYAIPCVLCLRAAMTALRDARLKN